MIPRGIKISTGVLAAAGLPALLLASSASTLAASQPHHQVVLRVWDMNQANTPIGKEEHKYIAEFEKAHPGVTVKLTIIPYADYFHDLTVAVKAGKAPDIATVDEIWTPAFAASKAIVPLSSLMKRYHLNSANYFKPAWQTTLYHGQSYGIPWSFDVWEQLYWNKTMFAKAHIAGPPKTWPQMLADAKKLTHAPNQYGIAVIGDKGEDTVVVMDSLIYSNGGSIEKNGKVTFDSSKVKRALTFYKDLSKYAPPGAASATESTSIGLFSSGKVAMAFDGSWQQATLQSQAPHLNWGIAVPPAPTGKKFHGTLGGWNLVVFKQSKHYGLDMQYIKWMTKPNVEVKVASLIPANKKAGIEFVKKDRRQPSIILNTLNNGYPRPISPNYLTISTIQQNAMSEIWTGTPVGRAVAQAATEMKHQ